MFKISSFLKFKLCFFIHDKKLFRFVKWNDKYQFWLIDFPFRYSNAISTRLAINGCMIQDQLRRCDWLHACWGDSSKNRQQNRCSFHLVTHPWAFSSNKIVKATFYRSDFAWIPVKKDRLHTLNTKKSKIRRYYNHSSVFGVYSLAQAYYYTPHLRRDGWVVESTGLENRHTLIAYLGFKSLSLRHILKVWPRLSFTKNWSGSSVG